MIQDIKTRQRLLNLAGYNAGKVDGIIGPKTTAAQKQWDDTVATVIRATGTFDHRTEKNLLTLLPDFQLATRNWLIRHALPAAAEAGLTLKIICGTRDYAAQATLYAKGRTTTGPKVTNARPGYSFHNFGVAFDIGLFTPTGAYITQDAPYITLIRKAGTPTGAVWGGTFKSFKDYPHIESHLYGATTAILRKNSTP